MVMTARQRREERVRATWKNSGVDDGRLTVKKTRSEMRRRSQVEGSNLVDGDLMTDYKTRGLDFGRDAMKRRGKR